MAARLAVTGVAIDIAGDVAEAEKLVARHAQYRLILLDLLLPDSRGFSGLMRLRFAAETSPVAIITARDDVHLAGIAKSLGAVGFFSKAEPLDALAGKIRRVVTGDFVFPCASQAAPIGPVRSRIASLSDAQRRVLFALAGGQSNKQIASELGLSEATIKAHMTAIFRGLAVSNRAQALLILQPLLGDFDDESVH